MAEMPVSLTLDRMQRTQLFAHLLVYQLSFTMAVPRDKTRVEGMREVAYRLFQLCQDAREEVVLTLRPDECQVTTEVLLLLKTVYEQTAGTEASACALEHLAACLTLIEQAAHHTPAAEGESMEPGGK